jgi:hypothetical protein
MRRQRYADIPTKWLQGSAFRATLLPRCGRAWKNPTDLQYYLAIGPQQTSNQRKRARMFDTLSLAFCESGSTAMNGRSTLVRRDSSVSFVTSSAPPLREKTERVRYPRCVRRPRVLALLSPDRRN